MNNSETTSRKVLHKRAVFPWYHLQRGSQKVSCCSVVDNVNHSATEPPHRHQIFRHMQHAREIWWRLDLWFVRICVRTDRQTDRHSHHNTALSWRMKELTWPTRVAKATEMEDARLLVRKVVGRDVFQRCPRPVSQQFSTQSLCFITVPLISPEISPPPPPPPPHRALRFHTTPTQQNSSVLSRRGCELGI